MKRGVSILSLTLLLCACGETDSPILGTWRNADNQFLNVYTEGPDGVFAGELTQVGDCGPVVQVEVNRDPYEQYSILVLGPTPMIIPEDQAQTLPSPNYCITSEVAAICTFCQVTDQAIEECDSTDQDLNFLPVTIRHHCGWSRVSLTPADELIPGGSGCVQPMCQ